MITVTDVSKVYQSGEVETHALKKINVMIENGEFIVILGPSGSGKSTLLNVISGLDTVTEGTIFFAETELTALSEREMTKFRRDHLGFIFQQYNLLQNLTAYENVQIGADIGQNPFPIDDLLGKVGLTKARDKYPYQLSGGEQLRVSVARSLAKNPDIIFCDEPTGSLDEINSKKVLKLLQELNTAYEKTIVVITHNAGIAEMADKVIKMNSGEIIELIYHDVKKDAQDISWG
ncbi:ABC transporter ATP-binding protein [Salisediminibacterium halotolerans]|uniref:ABC transport system ATP-binding protein n=1 Tax=Salisediminibacterium halotolerans TaxID=517425 RepID=A0A1H9SWU4_9BACI|nr:ABC transporter ATP-binding protein [Salisediminibacterium haloalkalitolerans]SER89327.1 putative ABC transport system ATP-binding protein [Salisediminibacterium haloalkalitolerans]